MKFFAPLALAASLFPSAPAQAVTVIYDEAVDGDLNFPLLVSRSLANEDTFRFKGTTTRGFSSSPTDLDILELTLASGLEISAYEINLTSFSSSSNAPNPTFSPNIQLGNLDSGFERVFSAQFSNGTSAFEFDILPYQGERFQLSFNGGCGGCIGPSSYTYDWTVDITTSAVAPVPLPPSLAVMGLSMLALFGWRKRA